MYHTQAAYIYRFYDLLRFVETNHDDIDEILIESDQDTRKIRFARLYEYDNAFCIQELWGDTLWKVISDPFALEYILLYIHDHYLTIKNICVYNVSKKNFNIYEYIEPAKTYITYTSKVIEQCLNKKGIPIEICENIINNYFDDYIQRKQHMLMEQLQHSIEYIIK